MTGHQHDGQGPVLYAEPRSALRWPMYVLAVTGTLLVAGFIAGVAVTDDPDWSWLMGLGYLGLILGGVFIGMNFRTGIKVSEDGIRIGGVEHARRRHRGNLPWGDAHRKEVFFCPWNGVRRAAVITDRATLKDAGRLRLPGVKLGVMWAPFAKAALLIEIDPRHAVFPQFREPDEKRPLFRLYHPGPNHPSVIWYVPTKHPDELRAVLAQHVASPHYASSLNTHPYLFEKEDVTLSR